MILKIKNKQLIYLRKQLINNEENGINHKFNIVAANKFDLANNNQDPIHITISKGQGFDQISFF